MLGHLLGDQMLNRGSEEGNEQGLMRIPREIQEVDVSTTRIRI